MFHSDIDPKHLEELMRRLKEIQEETVRKILYGDPDKPRQKKSYYGTPLFEDLERAFFEHDARPLPYTEEQARLARHEIRDAEIDGGE